MESKNEETHDPAYQRVFTALDELSLAFLKPFFKKNDLQDDTFSFMKSEEELRNLLRKELELPFGQAFKFSRHWFNKYHDSAETLDSGIQPPQRGEKSSHLHSTTSTSTTTEVHETSLPFTTPCKVNEYSSQTQPPNSIQITDESGGFRDSTTLTSQKQGKKDETVKPTKEQECSKSHPPEFLCVSSPLISLSGRQLKEGIPEEKRSCQPGELACSAGVFCGDLVLSIFFASCLGAILEYEIRGGLVGR